MSLLGKIQKGVGKITKGVKSFGDNTSDLAQKWVNNPGEMASDLSKRTVTGALGFGMDLFTGAPLWNGGKSMGYESMFGDKTQRNDVWGDPMGANARRDLEADETAQQQLIDQQKAKIAENVSRTGAIYGYGSSPEAQANAMRLSDIIGSQVQGQGSASASGMSQDLQQQLQQLSAMFARSGMTGSGLEQQSLNEAIASYGSRRSTLGTNLEGMRQQLYDSLRGRSQAAQEAVAKGQDVAPDAMYRDQINTLNRALSGSALSSGLEGLASGVNTGTNAILARAGGASPQALEDLMRQMIYQYNTEAGGKA